MFNANPTPPPASPSPMSSVSSASNSTTSASRPARPPSVVVETLHATTSENSAGQKRINQYTLEKEIGHGAFGTVHLGRDTDGYYYVSCLDLNLIHNVWHAINSSATSDYVLLP
ncbi:hypothetical protein NQZ79_g8813 [Umbelopsis isabellina]|nr:hypothetical protein NQZ79_g8813 [Umbelopsis isabellina]